jgi:hypothetical protein
MAYLLYKSRPEPGAVLRAGWRDSLDAIYRLPGDWRALPLPAADSAVVTDSMVRMSGSDSALRLRTVTLRRLQRGDTLAPDERRVLDASRRDTALARLAPIAGRTGDAAMTLLADAPDAARLMWPAGRGITAPFIGFSRLGSALLLRGEARALAGDAAGARADFGAVIALGHRLYAGEPSAGGVATGARLMGEGADLLGRLAAGGRDTALARRAGELKAWAARARHAPFLGFLPADTLLLLAQDSLLPRGVRVAVLESSVSSGFLGGVASIVFGPPRVLRELARDAQRTGDPVVSRAATIAERSLAQIHAAGFRGRYRMITRPPH